MDILRSILAAALGVVITTPPATTNNALQVSMTIAPSCTILASDLNPTMVQHLESMDATTVVHVDCNDVLPLSIVFIPDAAVGADTLPGSDPPTDKQPQQVDGDLTNVVSVITF